MNILKREVDDAIKSLGTIKIWMQLLVPKIADGNNFGVGVQEECLGEVARVEDTSFGVLDDITKYFATRAKICAKLLKHPQITDFLQALIEVDQNQYITFRLALVDMRNNYALLFDLLNKNFDKIKKPRGQDLGPSAMMM